MKAHQYRINSATGEPERIAVVEIDEATGETFVDAAATTRLHSPEERRRMAYIALADPHRDRYFGYVAEAEAWRRGGKPALASEAAAKADAALQAYAEKKREIRARIPDNGSVT